MARGSMLEVTAECFVCNSAYFLFLAVLPAGGSKVTITVWSKL